MEILIYHQLYLSFTIYKDTHHLFDVFNIFKLQKIWNFIENYTIIPIIIVKHPRSSNFIKAQRSVFR